MTDDAELLRRYAEHRDEAAFAELVQRHLGLVYHAALRQCGGDAHRAEDVAQLVFTDLARKTEKLARRPLLAGWLYTSTRYAAAQAVRTEARRQAREQAAHAMNEIFSATNSAPAAEWDRLRPVIDDALHALGERDREAVLLRFFEGRAFADVGAKLFLSEDAARMRVDRALEKLRAALARRGITSTSAALGVVLANQAAAAVPTGIAASVTGAALAGAAATASGGAGALSLLNFMSTTKTISGLAGVVAILAIGSAVYESNVARKAESSLVSISGERDQLRARLASMEKRAQESNENLAADQKESKEPRPNDASLARPTSRPSAAQAMSTLNYVATHPETRPLFVEQQVLRTKTQFERFFKSAALSPQQEDRFLKLMTEAANSSFDLLEIESAQGLLGPNLSTEQAQQLGRLDGRIGEDTNAKLRDLLGDDAFSQYRQFQQKITTRNAVDDLARQLYFTDTPLTAAQAEQMVQVVWQNRFRLGQTTPSPITMLGGEILSDDIYRAARLRTNFQTMSSQDWVEPITDAAMAQAQGVLTPAQIEAMKRLQARQRVELRLTPPGGG